MLGEEFRRRGPGSLDSGSLVLLVWVKCGLSCPHPRREIRSSKRQLQCRPPRPPRPPYQVLLTRTTLCPIERLHLPDHRDRAVRRAGLAYRSLVWIRRIFSASASPGTLTTPSSPTTRLPHEVIEEIVSHLFCHTPSLHACSWYIAAAPPSLSHPYHSNLLLGSTGGLAAPTPSNAQVVLLPLVKNFQVLESHYVLDFPQNGSTPAPYANFPQ